MFPIIEAIYVCLSPVSRREADGLRSILEDPHSENVAAERVHCPCLSRAHAQPSDRSHIQCLSWVVDKTENHRLDQIYLDRLGGEIDEGFYRVHVAAWKKEQAQVRKRIERHESANHTYIDQGIRLLELAQNAHEFSRSHGQEEPAILLRFILQGSTLQDGTVVPPFKPPFDIIHGLATDPREANRLDIKSRPPRMRRPAQSSSPGRWA